MVFIMIGRLRRVVLDTPTLSLLSISFFCCFQTSAWHFCPPVEPFRVSEYAVQREAGVHM